jgi:hypothetical protein
MGHVDIIGIESYLHTTPELPDLAGNRLRRRYNKHDIRGRQCMRRSKSESLLGLTGSFFHSYLQHTRGASAHTVRAYRDALKLFYLFLADQKRKPVADLDLDNIQSDAVLAFLGSSLSHVG